jgi:hypothetical protein
MSHFSFCTGSCDRVGFSKAPQDSTASAPYLAIPCTILPRCWCSLASGSSSAVLGAAVGCQGWQCASVVGISMEPSVVGRDWSPVSSDKARGCCCRTSCRPPSPIAAGACSPAVFAHMWRIASRPPGARGRAGAGAAGASYTSCALVLYNVLSTGPPYFGLNPKTCSP